MKWPILKRPILGRISFNFLETRLTSQTVELAAPSHVVCAFVNDCLDRSVLSGLQDRSVELVALRSAGFNNVDLHAAMECGIKVVRVPKYSPHAVAEHAVGLMLSLNRKIHRAYNRIREHNFSLNGLVGFDLYQKKVGIIGVGKIGAVLAKIMSGFGCEVLLYDKNPKEGPRELEGASFRSLEEVLELSDIMSLHLPLTPETKHIINQEALRRMKPGAMLINTGRGGLVDSGALLQSLKSGHLGYAGLDVYEEEENVFFRDLSEFALKDECLARLITFPNVLITSHQAFLTKEALKNIAQTTVENILAHADGRPLLNEVLLNTK